LNHAATAAAQDLPGVRVGQTAVAGVRDGEIGVAQVEMIECVQTVATELNLVTLLEIETLLDADVPVPETRTEKHVPRRIAVLPRLRRSEGRGIEPLHALHDVVRVLLSGIQIGSGDGVGTPTPPADNVRRNREGKTNTCLRGSRIE